MAVTVFLLTVLLSSAGIAQGSAKAKTSSLSAHETVERATANFLTLLRSDGNKERDMAKLYGRVEEVLDPFVSFSFISKGVMGGYYKKATAEQKKEFITVFKRSMVETLTKGMLSFADFETQIIAPQKDLSGKKKLEVIQEVASPKGVNRVSYTMAYSSKAQRWKLINVLLNGVNLGISFREQFAHSAKQNKGDLAAVIANWNQSPKS